MSEHQAIGEASPLYGIDLARRRMHPALHSQGEADRDARPGRARGLGPLGRVTVAPRSQPKRRSSRTISSSERAIASVVSLAGKKSVASVKEGAGHTNSRSGERTTSIIIRAKKRCNRYKT